MSRQDELYNFVSSHFYGTGEGSTTSLLITRAYPRADDYEVDPEWIQKDGKYEYHPGLLKNGAGFRAIRQFAEVFDGFYAQGAELHTCEEFLKKYEAYIPKVIVNVLSSKDQPGNLHWHAQLHLNFS